MTSSSKRLCDAAGRTAAIGTLALAEAATTATTTHAPANSARQLRLAVPASDATAAATAALDAAVALQHQG